MEDDGQGIDISKVRRRLVESGMEPEDVAESLPENELIKYLFKPNFSTAEKVTDLSGRGVGLDAVKQKLKPSEVTGTESD